MFGSQSGCFAAKLLVSTSIPRIMRREISGGSAYEEEFGYSRAVVVDRFVFVAATSGVDTENNRGLDSYTQTRRALEKIGVALSDAGFQMEDIVRLRVYAKPGLLLDDFKKAYAEFFNKTRPAVTLVYVTGFPSPEALLEIEAEAVGE